MGNNGLVIRELQGSKKDFIGAWIVRFIVCGLLAYGSRTGLEIRDDTRDLKKDWPKIHERLDGMDKHLQVLDEQGKTFATQKQLEEAELRVKHEFLEQLKRGKIITTTQGK